ncbi:hypothetical protein J2Z83_002619 [Virgibacillus natechei]|uniref:Uncharacterized protein n=1 Tax=Virgibacillus natechei TaxID=1216297 RepID=A0ABS4IHR7_9BACI|nr:hypothetical protein [Virgibacillus natechei]MBP1970498.1 hypothetical protein [Virgibacillus natechei]UZD14097.1 hypothetical protein OLD84_06145 [Virgibacillus natechei]
MKNIDAILEAFLEEQSNRLKQKTYRDYDDVIHFFQVYLNSYAANYLDEDEWKKWEAKFDEDEDAFTKMFGVEKLSSTKFSEFLDYFIIRKVMSGESFMEIAVRVMKKLNKWLYDNNYTDLATYNDLREYFGEAKDLPKVEKMADLIFQQARKTQEKQFDEIEEGYFSVKAIEQGEIWLDETFGDKTNIGPVNVSKQISDLYQKGWQINLVIGKDQGKWHILESENVYPY